MGTRRSPSKQMTFCLRVLVCLFLISESAVPKRPKYSKFAYFGSLLTKFCTFDLGNNTKTEGKCLYCTQSTIWAIHTTKLTCGTKIAKLGETVKTGLGGGSSE